MILVQSHVMACFRYFIWECICFLKPSTSVKESDLLISANHDCFTVTTQLKLSTKIIKICQYCFKIPNYQNINKWKRTSVQYTNRNFEGFHNANTQRDKQMTNLTALLFQTGIPLWLNLAFLTKTCYIVSVQKTWFCLNYISNTSLLTCTEMIHARKNGEPNDHELLYRNFSKISNHLQKSLNLS